MGAPKFNVEIGEFAVLTKLKRQFPELMAQMMGFVGVAGTRMLKKRFLSGQELNLNKYPKDKAGRRTVRYSIGKNIRHVTITSYPLNLFETGRKLRSGRKEPGKHILKRKFKQIMMSELNSIAADFDSKFLTRELNKL